MSAAKSKPPREVWAYFNPFMGEWVLTSDETEAEFMSASACYILADAPKPRKRATKRKPKP